ncbi:MAG: hypothetical protein KAT65_04080 [Methanophagales archaeon]|nr:hypothetical protein [Methanophagales archaeon]
MVLKSIVRPPHKSSKTTEIYTYVSNRDLNKIKSPLDMRGGEDMSEYIQKGYIRIADIIPILDDMHIADIPKLYAIPHTRQKKEWMFKL